MSPSRRHLWPSMMLVAWVASAFVAGCAAARQASSSERATASTDVPPLPPGAHAPPGTGGIMAAPGDAEAAIRSEFRSAEMIGTAAAYALFVQRHEGHKLAKEAARRAAALAGPVPEASR